MRTILRITKRGTVKLVGQARYAILANAELWGETFWSEWEALPVDKKLAWFLFLNHTIAILTLIELFVLRRGK